MSNEELVMSNLREEENYLCNAIKFAQAVFPLWGNGKGAEPNYYIHDAQGNVLAVYGSSRAEVPHRFYLFERHIYGTNRLGIYYHPTDIIPSSPEPVAYTRGEKYYELSNHLGNVSSTITDRKIQTYWEGVYVPDVKSYVDYYPFGFPMEDRSWQQIAYRYGFNGQEKDNEIYGVGNFLNFEFRGYDSRLGRWWSVDPLIAEQPWQSSYLFCSGNPINRMDPTGMLDLEDITITGTNNSSLTIKTDAIDLTIRSGIDFGGNHTVADLSSVAVGYEYGVNATGAAGVGTSYNAYKMSALFLGGDYSGYWYDYAGAEAQLIGTTSAEGTVGVQKNYFIAFNSNKAGACQIALRSFFNARD